MIFTVVPVLEEIMKTTAAIFAHSSILSIHIVFGAVEAIIDLLSPGYDDWPAALTSLGSHAFLGWLTQTIWQASTNIWLAIASAAVAHILWNTAVIFFRPLR
ncbi:hypothetical protein RDV78_07270 [Bacillota bacterium LX-D]|nr:hypothetical protein [Bacillota bacterium LX-D]